MSSILLASKEFNTSKETQIFEFHIFDRSKIELQFSVKEDGSTKSIKSNFKKALNNFKLLREEVGTHEFDRYLTVISNKLNENKGHLIAQGLNTVCHIDNVSLYEVFKAELNATK